MLSVQNIGQGYPSTLVIWVPVIPKFSGFQSGPEPAVVIFQDLHRLGPVSAHDLRFLLSENGGYPQMDSNGNVQLEK